MTIQYVFELPVETLRKLSENFDPNDAWEEIALLLPGIGNVDVEACRQARPPTSATNCLLRIWGSKGYLIADLYKVFAMAKLVKGMEIIKEYVEPKYHELERTCISKGSVQTLKMALNESKHQVSSIGIRSENVLHPSVSTSKAQSSTSVNSTPSGMTNLGAELYSGLQNTPTVKYEELLVATNSFAPENVIGKGGYGVVYRGEWKHTAVAVKKIQTKNGKGAEHEKERLRQSLQELRTLAKYRHDNILPLYGFSMDGPTPCLVYQFMANGSLEDRLLCRKDSRPLSWEQKLQISSGASRGLHFLHTIGRTPIIHGDVKTANILLDKHFEPKLGDFGLSRDGQAEADIDQKSPLIASHIKGTLAYLPPEFITSKILSTKLDVYSFGVVLLEIASGLRAYSDNREPHGIVDYAKRLKTEAKHDPEKLMATFGDKRTKLVDKAQNQRYFATFVTLGLQCAEKDRMERPTFREIVDAIAVLEE
uniref:non-specific serine/threonine protein kinase n=1 Tax=Steinernema glaseri TaxID=37863 RepID=A0A1I7Y333_9BILA